MRVPVSADSLKIEGVRNIVITAKSTAVRQEGKNLSALAVDLLNGLDGV